MELSTRPLPGRADAIVVSVVGEIDSQSAEQFRQDLVALVNSDVKHLVLNLSDLSYINSSGLGALVAAYKRVRTLDGSLRLCHVRGAIAEVMKLIRLHTIVDIFDTEEAACASL
jgi:anti-anti-sigma factor